MENVDTRALTGATLYWTADEPPIRDATVLIRQTAIANAGARSSVAVPAGTKIIDCAGGAICAGFWNAHVHFHERKWADAANIPVPELERQLQGLTRYGFTSCIDLSSPLQNTRSLRSRIESREARGPRIFTTGEGLIPIGGSPSVDVFRALGLMPTGLREVTDAAHARGAVIDLLDAGVDAIKLFVSAPSAGSLALETACAAVNAAHDAGKLAFAHPNTASDVLEALEAGVDVIAHTTPHSGAWDEDLLSKMSARRVALIPTLMLWDDLMRHDRASVREKLLTVAVEQLRAWRELDGTVLFGTDLGAVKYDPTDEYRLMAQAGMTLSEILSSLTTLPARLFGDGRNRGEIRTGDVADLTVLRADPADDVRYLSSVRYTVRAGEIIYESS